MSRFNVADLLLLKAKAKGWHSIFSGVDYSRTTEWPLAADMLRLADGQRVLDVGSGDASLFPLLLAFKVKTDVLAADYSDPMTYLKGLAAEGIRKRWLAGRLQFENADLRRLPYADESFDRAACVSTIEHVPGDGDSEGIRELGRVLKRGGRLVVTAPFAAAARDEYKPDHVYERSGPGELVFFQRFYDFDTLQQRLIGPSGLRCEEKLFLCEPGRRYFWEQDCPRSEVHGKTLLGHKTLSYRERALALPYSFLYTKLMNEKEARASAARLYACAIAFSRE
jgi:SAM-dependent methyltransferase